MNTIIVSLQIFRVTMKFKLKTFGENTSNPCN